MKFLFVMVTVLVSAAAFAFNGNGEMTGTHWINEAGYLETPIVLTDTLDVGRADDGVISWMILKYPQIGRSDDVPLPVVAECDDQYLNDIQGRHVSPDDVVALLNGASAGQFSRGSVGAGTGMKAFGFKGGIGSASRVLPKAQGGYTVGILVNDNTGSTRGQLTIDGVHVGEKLLSQSQSLSGGARAGATLGGERGGGGAQSGPLSGPCALRSRLCPRDHRHWTYFAWPGRRPRHFSETLGALAAL